MFRSILYKIKVGVGCMNYSTRKLDVNLRKISEDTSHKLNGLAVRVLDMQKEADDIKKFSQVLKDDVELQRMSAEDVDKIAKEIEKLSREFLLGLVIVPCDEILLELSAGVGGQEAMLFANDLYNLYLNYSNYKGWEVSTVQYDVTEFGGLRHGTLLITSSEAYDTLFMEGGVHRVQRVPKTEKSGRIHTSTATVSILPTIYSKDLHIPTSDLKIERKKASGAGGQHVNTTESAVRVTHIPSGIVVDCQTERSQIQNRSSALKILKSKLYEMEDLKNEKKLRDDKKSQVGKSERNEKIRTLNCIQDRITDHRVMLTIYNAKNVMNGGLEFENFLLKLREEYLNKLYHD